MSHEDYGLHTTQVFGHVHPDTQAFDDVATLNLDPHYTHIQSIEVVYDTLIFGIIVTYHKAPGTSQILHHIGTEGAQGHKAAIHLAPDEYVVHVSGHHGNVYDHLKIVTNKGQTLDVGGSGGEPFDMAIPAHHTILGFKGGLGGHIHNLSLVLRPSFDWNPQTSNKVGGSHQDTRPWDDLGLLAGAHFCQITAIRASSIGSYVSGLSITYLLNGKDTRAGEWHQGSETDGEKVTKKLKLKGNEFITKVEGGAGALVDHLKITTSAGQVLEVGGAGGEPFELHVPAGRRVVAFGGGTNGHLHNLYVHFN